MNTSPNSEATDTQMMSMDSIVPYWRNPRNISDEAVDRVAESIREYGYQQPIVVDHQNTIVIGHTRYAALRRLGVTSVEVKVTDGLTDAQVKQLRVVDNRAGEYTEWDFEKLADELATLDSDTIDNLFGAIDLGDEPDTADLDAEFDTEENTDSTPTTFEQELFCPSCFHSWLARFTFDDLATGHLPAETTATTEETK